MVVARRVPLWRGLLAVALVAVACVTWRRPDLVMVTVFAPGMAAMLLTTGYTVRSTPPPAQPPWPTDRPRDPQEAADRYERLVALRGWALDQVRARRPRSRASRPRPPGPLRFVWPVLAALGVTGAVALALDPVAGLLLGGCCLLVGLLYLAVGDGGRLRRRHGPMREWVRGRQGWTYQPVEPGLAVWWSGPPFDHGAAHVCREVLWRGSEALSCTVLWEAPVRRRPGTRRDRTAHVVAVVLPAPLPRVVLTPHADDGPVERFDQDVVTESPDFNRHWRVRSGDARLAHGVLHPVVLDRLMRADLRHAGVCLDGSVIRAWWPGPTDLDLVEERLAAVADLAVLIPRHVWQDHGYDPGVVACPGGLAGAGG